MNIPVIFQFLKELSANNNREWFNAHREQYENARNEFENLLTVIISRISLFDESIRGIEARDCTYRIYRDTRFSEDKTPYKNHFGGYINAKGKKSDHCGYYVHLQPSNCLLAGGSYCPPSPLLKALRQAVYDNMDEFRGIVEDPAFKEYTVSCHQPDSFFLAPDFLERTDDIFRQLKRFSDFVNYTIDDFE